MSTVDQLNQIVTEVQAVVTELSVPATDSVGDQVFAAIIPVLESAGYTVTAPEVETPAEDATDTSAEA